MSATKPATFFPASFSPPSSDRAPPPLPYPPSQAAEAGNEYAGGTAASFEALPKRIRNLQKKATLESAGVKLHAPQKGWPRGYEFGARRLRRKLTPSDWDAAQRASWPVYEGELAW